MSLSLTFTLFSPVTSLSVPLLLSLSQFFSYSLSLPLSLWDWQRPSEIDMNNKVLNDCQTERDSNNNSESKTVRDRKNDSDVMTVTLWQWRYDSDRKSKSRRDSESDCGIEIDSKSNWKWYNVVELTMKKTGKVTDRENDTVRYSQGLRGRIWEEQWESQQFC